MKYFILIITLAANCSYGYAQLQNANWVFGDSIGLYFSSDSILFFNSKLGFYEASSSVSDKEGNLLFYTNGQSVYNKNHELMENGDSLTIGKDLTGLSSTTQGALILQTPESDNLYYIFYLPYQITTEDEKSGIDYSILDISLNDGLGKVIAKNIELLNLGDPTFQGVMEKMQCVRHANGRDWWLVVRDYNNDYLISSFYLYLITPIGIDESFKQNIVPANWTFDYGSKGEMLFNNIGDLMIYTSSNQLDFFSFNRCNGLFTYMFSIQDIQENSYEIYGIAFSPDDSKLYVSTLANNKKSTLYQFCLNCEKEVEDTKTTIYKSHVNNYSIGQLEQAIDGRIYFGLVYYFVPNEVQTIYNTHLSSINDPNSLYCYVDTFAISLNSHRFTSGLPNLPNYSLGALTGSECDTLSSSLSSIYYNSSFTIAPNPVQEMFYIKTKQNTGSVFSLCIVNTQGAEAMYLPKYTPGSTVAVSHLPEGMYAVLLTDEKGLLHQQKLIISR